MFLWAKINGSPNIDFLLDTGCSGTLLAKEVGDILFLKGNLVESDIKGFTTSSYGGVYNTQVKEINIRNLSIGKVRLKNVNATISDRYGGSTLLGMAALDKMGNFTITKDKLIIDDGKPESVTTTGRVKDCKPNKSRFKGCIKRIRTIREESGLENYKFDYSKYVLQIYHPIQSCYPLLMDKKFTLVCEILEELQPLIKENLEDDEKHINHKGAFITAYFNYYLASAYYGLERYEEALTYYGKAKIFFLSGSSILNEINDITQKIRETLEEKAKDTPKVFAPAKTTTFEEDVLSYKLLRIDYIDNYYGAGEIKTALVGFQNYRAAYTFCRMNHKRLEVLSKNEGKWQRTGSIPADNLSYGNLIKEEGYGFYSFYSDIDRDLKKLTEQLGENENEIEQITKNAERAKEILKSEESEKRFYSTLALHESNLAFDALIMSGASLSWHGQEYVLAAIDVEEFITKKLGDDVLAGRIIPCATGQMPEDYIYLADKTSELKPYSDKDYTANNDPQKSRNLGPFILYDEGSCVGYGYRTTYDDKYWRWEDVSHSNVGGFPKYSEDTSKENDCQICYWQLVVKRDEDKNGFIHPEAF